MRIVFCIVLLFFLTYGSSAFAKGCEVISFQRIDSQSPAVVNTNGFDATVTMPPPQRCANITIQCSRRTLIHTSEFYALFGNDRTGDGEEYNKSKRVKAGEAAVFFTCFGISGSPIVAVGYQRYPYN